MGRYYRYRKATVEESCDLTIFQLKKRTMLSGRTTELISWRSNMTGERTSLLLTVDITGEPYARFMHVAGDAQGDRIERDYRVSLQTTPCNLGGVRYWFACPECRRRVGGLYLARGRRSFMCRSCANLTYRSRTCTRIEAWGAQVKADR